MSTKYRLKIISGEHMMEKTEIVKTMLADGTIVHVQATALGGEEEVASALPSFQNVTNAVESIATAFMTSMRKVKPQKASVEFGVEIALESGQLTALIVKGSGTTNLKITLEWEKEADQNQSLE